MKPQGFLSGMFLNTWNSVANVCRAIVSGGIQTAQNFPSVNPKATNGIIFRKLSPHEKWWMKIRYANLKFRHDYEESQTLLKVKEKKKISLSRWRKIWSHSRTK